MKKILPAIAVSLLLLVAGITVFVTCTTPGLALLIRLTEKIAPGEVSVAAIKGSLIKGVILHKVRYTDSSYEVVVTDAAITVKLAALLRKQLVITSLHLNNVSLKELQPAPSSNTNTLPQITLPIALYLEQAVLDSLEFHQLAPKKRLDVQQLSLERFSMKGNHLQIESLNLLHQQGSVELKGELQTNGDYPLHITSAYHLTLDHYQPIAGEAIIKGNLFDCLVTSTLTTPAQATISSRFIMDGGLSQWSMEATGNTVDISAINHQWPNLVLGEVHIKGRGTLDKAALTIQTTSTLTDYPPLQDIATHATLELNEERLQITELRIQKGSSLIHATGHLDWKDAMSWSVHTQIQEFDPSIWFTGWQGTLHGNGSMQGHLSSTGVYADFALDELQGQLRGYPLNGQGKASLQGKTLNIHSFEVSSGDSQLTADGVWGHAVNLHFSLQSPDIDQLWPDAAGAITSTGTVHGTREDPALQLHLSGNKIAYNNKSIGRLEASVKGKLQTDKGLALHLTASDVTVFDQHTDDVLVTITGNAQNVALEARLKEKNQVANISLSGEQKKHQWNGRIERVTIDTQTIGSWKIKQPAAFTATATQLQIDAICLTSALAEQICTSGSYAVNAQWTVTGNIERLATQTVQSLLAQKNLFQGYLQGSWHLAGHNKTLDNAKLTIALVDTAMVLPAAAQITSLSSMQGNLNATYADNELTATTRMSLADGSFLDTALAVSTAEAIQSSEAFDFMLLPITGHMVVQVKDVAVANVLVEEYAKIAGMMQGTLKISGNIKHPILTGKIHLTQGTADLLAVGVTLDPLSVTAQITNNQLTLSANAQSAMGELSATGSGYIIDKGLSQEIQLRINGDHFEVVHTDAMHISVSPDLLVKKANGLISVTGTITFPKAHIFYEGGEKTITPSSDVVIVDAPNNTVKAEPALPLKTSITLIAGDAVDIDAYGLKGLVKGKLHVTDISGELPQATGTLLINNGSFTLYGQRLDIDVGRLLFSGGPLDNPGVEVRTEKRDNGTTVGMEVGGFLQHPEIRFYSSAVMEQYEILTRLLANSSSSAEVQDQSGVIDTLATKIGLPQLGKALQNSKNLLNIDDIRLETGDVFDDISLIIGTWLTPRFYVSYGHSLLKDSASFNTRYTLGKGFFLQTETGTTQNGGDIIYEVAK